MCNDGNCLMYGEFGWEVVWIENEWIIDCVGWELVNRMVCGLGKVEYECVCG